MAVRRVVVTGLGAVCPLGRTASEAWRAVIEGVCGISRLGEAYKDLPCRIAGQVVGFIPEEYATKSDLRSMSPATVFSLAAAKEALDDAKWAPTDDEGREQTGVAVGVGMVDLMDVCITSECLSRSYNRVSPYFVPRILPNMAAGNISIRHGFRGPNHSASTACATGAHSIGDAFRFIRHGDADVMVSGGAEACISPLAVAAFCRLRALSTGSNDTPELASRPFDAGRDGFVMGEGAAILVLEEAEHAKRRGASIYAEVLGYGLSGDAAHLTAPSQDGTGARLAMRRAIADAGLALEDVGYVNAHATSTPLGDAVESKAIMRLFGDHAKRLAVSSTKGSHGHLLGAAGNLEAVFAVKACQEGVLPPTLNLERPDEGIELNYVAKVKQQWVSDRRRVVLKNAFGFGGTNASLCFAEYR